MQTKAEIKFHGEGVLAFPPVKIKPRDRSGMPQNTGAYGAGEEFHLLHQIFEAQVDARPDAIAVIFGCTEMTYADMEARANRIARHLRVRGVRRDSRVGMLLPRNTDAYAAMLGILKAGAAYVA